MRILAPELFRKLTFRGQGCLSSQMLFLEDSSGPGLSVPLWSGARGGQSLPPSLCHLSHIHRGWLRPLSRNGVHPLPDKEFTLIRFDVSTPGAGDGEGPGWAMEP